MIERPIDTRAGSRPQRRAASACRLSFVAGLILTAPGCSPDQAEDRAVSAPAADAAGLTGIRYLSDGGSGPDYQRALEPRDFVFPDDHGSHPGFRTEWWYFTGNVFDSDQRHYGFELTMFRIALTAEVESRESALASNQIWMAHLAVTDTARRQFQSTERLSRGAPGLAGVSTETREGGSSVRVTVEDWTVTIDGERASLAAGDSDFGIALELRGLDRIVAQGNAGLDAKGPEPGNASYYFSAPRLELSGELRSAGHDPVTVTGSAWMDREWSTSALSPDIEGWDWFALQLDDGRDLMFYRLRGIDGSTSPFSGGSILDADGDLLRLDAASVELESTDVWTSRATGVRYPVAWRLSIPDAGLELDIEPRLANQELDLTVRYWEGAVRVSGQSRGDSVQGVGYLELAGY